MKSSKGMMWIAGLAVSGIGLAFAIQTAVNSATHMVPVYVAAKEIPVDHVIQDQDLQKEMRPAASLPEDAIKDPKQVVGKYTSTTILKGQVVEQAAVADAKTMREVVRRFGEDFVGMALQVDGNDMPIDQIHPGDIVAILGTFNEANNHIVTRMVAAEVPVTAVVPAEKKIIIAVPRQNALELARDKAAGKISVVLDSKAFNNVVNTPNLQSSEYSPDQNTIAPSTAPASASPSGTGGQQSQGQNQAGSASSAPAATAQPSQAPVPKTVPNP